MYRDSFTTSKIMPLLNLSPALSIQWLFLGVVGLLFLHSIVVRLRHPLSRIPSAHWSAKWCGWYNVYAKYAYSIRLVHYHAHLNQDSRDGFRPVVRTGVREVSIMTSEGIKTAFDGGFERSSWYSIFSNFGKPNMFSIASTHAHAKRKRIFASAYSKTTISQYRAQNIIKSRTAKILNFIGQQTSTNASSLGKSGPIIVRNVFRALQADIFTAFAFSEADGTNFLENLETGPNTQEDLGMDMMDLFHDDKRDSFFFWESEKPFKYFSRFIKPNALAAHTRGQRWLGEIISRYEMRNKLEDIEGDEQQLKSFEFGTYKKLLLWRNPETGKPLDWTERASEIMDHMVAGQDAVPAALEFTIRKLSARPEIQSQLRVELLTVVPNAVADRTYALIDNLPYLNAVIMESLRLVDTISSYQTRVVPKGGCEISGYHIPAGTIISAQPYLINRQPSIFHNPEVFDPSRWILPSDSYRALAKNMWTYSSGAQSCIGKELSLAIMKIVLVDIYATYATTLLNEDRTEPRPWEGADRMSEVQFEALLACEEDERVEKRAHRIPLSVSAQEV